MNVPLEDMLLEEIIELQTDNQTKGEVFKTLDLLPDFIAILDKKANIQFVNKAGCQIINVSKDKVYGKNFLSVFVPKKQHNAFLSHLENTKSNQPLIIELISTDKESIYLNTTIAALISPEGEVLSLLLSGSDISGLIGEKTLLERDNKMYENLVKNIPDVNLFVLDKDLNFIVSIGNRTPHNENQPLNYKGMSFYDIDDKKLIEVWQPLFESALQGKDVSSDYDLNNAFYNIWVFPIYNGEKIMGITAITQNVTEQKLIELKLRKSIESAENANIIKSEFLANISHEIRTPLNAILGFSEQLSQTELLEKQDEFVKVISKSSEHLLYLVNDILILSKIEANAIKFDESPFKIETVISYIYNSLKIRAEQRNLIFTYDIDPRLNMVLKGDPFRLRQIIINMVNNAIKFTHNGYVEIKCFLMEEKEDSIKVRFDVMDTGIGISPDKLATIFDQFRQADSRITKKYGGTGLGLTICKNLIDKQNGSLTVKSEEGMGTRFSFVLPFKKGSDTDLDDNELDELISGSLDGKKILLVDDDSVNRLLGKTILDKLNCEYELADSGKQAIELLRDKPFNAVLLDIHMPEISGIEVAKHVRKELKNTEVKLIAVTADVFSDDVINYYAAGIDDYLIKPYRELELYNKLRKVLKIKSDATIQSAEKVILSTQSTPAYNLRQLQDISEGNKEFIRNMIETFVTNAENATREFKDQMTQNKWNDIKETAHRILPSFRHLEAHHLIDKLTDIKNMTSKQFNTEKSKQLVNTVIKDILDMNDKLKSEL